MKVLISKEGIVLKKAKEMTPVENGAFIPELNLTYLGEDLQIVDIKEDVNEVLDKVINGKVIKNANKEEILRNKNAEKLKAIDDLLVKGFITEEQYKNLIKDIITPKE
jgi:hypothetical protein